MMSDKIDAAMAYFGGLEEMFQWQKDIFLKKLNADFEVLLATIEKKRNELQTKILNTYDGHITQAKTTLKVCGL